MRHSVLMLMPRLPLCLYCGHGTGVGIADRGARDYLLFAYRLVLCTILLSLVSYLAARAQPNQGYVPIWPSGGIGLALV